jgi:zinc and cadmium transporter
MGGSTNNIVSLFIALGLNTLASLGGGFIPSAFLHRHMEKVLSFASGVLMGAAFFDLIPEALELGQEGSVQKTWLFGALLLGFISFYLVELFLGSHAAGPGHRHDHDQAGPLLLAGDALHNFADGVAMTSAFLVDPQLGWIATLGVIMHELPQEIADYAILIARGWSKPKALLALFIVQASAFLGAGASLLLSSELTHATSLLLMGSAGGFLYVAAADLLPSLNFKRGRPGQVAKLLWLVGGVALMAAMAGLLHGHH